MYKMTRKDFTWFAEEIAPMIYPNDMKEFAEKIKAKSRNSRFDMDRFLEASKLAWEGRNSPHAQEDWLSIEIKQQYQEGKNNGSVTKAA